MKRLPYILPLFSLFLIVFACEKAEIVPSLPCSPFPSATHSKADLYQSILDEYTQKGLPGISLLIRDQEGEWSGSAGMADLQEGIPLQTCHVSKVASVTKLFVGVLVMQ